MTLGERVRAARQERNMTVAALAGASGLSKGFISQVERGLSLPSLDSLRRIAAALEVRPQNLIGDGRTTRQPAGGALLGSHRFQAASEHVSGSSIDLVVRSQDTQFASAKLAAGATLAHTGTTGKAHGFLVVLSGEAAFSNDSGDYWLTSGEMFSWNAALGYRIENQRPMPLMLALVLEDGASLPTVSKPVPDYYASLQQATSRAISAEGPLRLAALRHQARTLEGR